MRRDDQPGRHRHQPRGGAGRRAGRGDLRRPLSEPVAREAARALEERFGLGHPELGARLSGGFANDLFRIDSDDGPRVLRLERPPVDERDLDWEHGVVRRLAERLPEVCAPLAARDGATWFRAGDRVACLLPLLAGAPADPALPAHRDAAARALGRLHAAGAGLDPAPRPRLDPLPSAGWPPLRAPAPLAGQVAEMARARGWAIDWVRRVAVERAPRTGLVHGDYFPGNVLIDGDEVAGLLDWEEAQPDWLSWDLANAIGTFCFAGDELDRAAAGSFVRGYREAGGTAPPEEEDLLVPLMRVKRILEVLRAPTDRVPRWEHQRRNVRAQRRLA